MARPFANPLTAAVEQHMEAQARLRRTKAAMNFAIDKLIAANRIIDPIAFTPAQTQQSA